MSQNPCVHYAPECLPSKRKLYTLRGVSAVFVEHGVGSGIRGISRGVICARWAWTTGRRNRGSMRRNAYTREIGSNTVTHLVKTSGLIQTPLIQTTMST